MKNKCPICGEDHEHVDCPFLCNVNQAQSIKIAELRLKTSELQAALLEAIEVLEKRPDNYRPIFEGPREKHIPGVTLPTEWQCTTCWEAAPLKEEIIHGINPVNKKACWEGQAVGILVRLRTLSALESPLKEKGLDQNAQISHQD